jgi:hypothetical protein
LRRTDNHLDVRAAASAGARDIIVDPVAIGITDCDKNAACEGRRVNEEAGQVESIRAAYRRVMLLRSGACSSSVRDQSATNR